MYAVDDLVINRAVGFDEVVLTASKRDDKAVIRLERKYSSEIDDSKVHHVAGGPYKGILINKATESMDEVEPAEGRLEFLAYLVNVDHDNDALQDYWVLRFWFRGKADGMTKKRTFTEYFQDLMNPTNFPKNYVGFMKKALVLLKSYSLIKRVELEVEESTERPPEESIPPIKSFITVHTPDLYEYLFLPEVPTNDKTFLTFMVKAAADVHLAFSNIYSDLDRKTVEIIIGADGNTRSMLKDCINGHVKSEALTMNILSDKDFRYFWVSWANHHVEVGRGAQYGYGRFLHWKIPPNRQFAVNFLSVTTDESSEGYFEFAELLDATTDFGKEAKKARVKHSLLWIAKKQKMLQCLEEAYPNMMGIADLLRQSKIKSSDMTTAVIMLKDLQKKGLIREVEDGKWIRIQTSGETESDHEVKLVKDMPQLTGREQPTIAIITSLYCEKLAVDAMIDDKTTFVKYKTEGESQVYTLGSIGRFKVVSTKLSYMPGSEQTAMISAENTVTRLLGTFSKVEHVFLVGVGGAVPNYHDFSKHVRLGDVVVSIPSRRNGPLYTHCSKVENISGGYAYNTRTWSSPDHSLQNVVNSLNSIVEYDWMRPHPWKAFIEQGQDMLKGQETNFHRPSSKDILYLTRSDGTTLEVEHPKPVGRQQVRGYKEGQPNIRYGVIGSGRLVARTDRIRRDFAELNDIKAYDVNFEAVLESLEGNRNESFVIVRGMVDYFDGTRKEWQGYASLVAAAYMKAIVMAM